MGITMNGIYIHENLDLEHLRRTGCTSLPISSVPYGLKGRHRLTRQPNRGGVGESQKPSPSPTGRGLG